MLAAAIVGHPLPPPRWPVGPLAGTPIGIAFRVGVIVFIAPIAEEIFFRGYVLEQLTKLTRAGIALSIQSILFALAHLYALALFSSISFTSFNLINHLLFGLIAGAWRIRFKSLLPLVLVHMLCNAAVLSLL